MTVKKEIEGEVLPKVNKDGLQGGKLVSPDDHAKVLLAKRKAAAKKAAK